MAELSTENRARIWRALQRYWSRLLEGQTFSSTLLLEAINATDTWIDANAASYNSALPAAARTALTTDQKTLLFCAVALVRADAEIARLLRQALGVEVD